MNYPSWWDWELEFTPHLRKRMAQRDFTEIELREMWDRCHQVIPDAEEEGRWAVRTTHRGAPWEIIVEPDPESQSNVVITAYSDE